MKARKNRLPLGQVIPFDALDIIKQKLQPQFPDSDEGRLFFAIVYQAICDALMPIGPNTSRDEKRDAIEYLSGDIIHAQVLGIDPDWIYETCLRVFTKYKEVA